MPKRYVTTAEARKRAQLAADQARADLFKVLRPVFPESVSRHDLITLIRMNTWAVILDGQDRQAKRPGRTRDQPEIKAAAERYSAARKLLVEAVRLDSVMDRRRGWAARQRNVWDRSVADRLGVSASGLAFLARAKASTSGTTTRRGNECVPLRAKGLIDDQDRITDAGRDLVDRARAMGW